MRASGRPRRYQPNLDQTPEWNRGAYLVEALEHCGEAVDMSTKHLKPSDVRAMVVYLRSVPFTPDKVRAAAAAQSG